MTATNTFGPYRGVVDAVHDGDTIYVKLDVGFDLTVYARCRILGINAPELSTQAGKDARTFAQTIVHAGDEVSVMSHGWDKYGGRIDAEITLADYYWYKGERYDDFGKIMLVTGHAVEYAG